MKPRAQLWVVRGNTRINHSFYGGVQVAAPWHMTNVPLAVQLGLLVELVSCQSPNAIPLLRVVFVVPFALPVTVPFAVSVRTLPAGTCDLTVNSIDPVTALVEVVTRLAEPLGNAETKHDPAV